MLGSGTKPLLPNEFWIEAFEYFYEMKFRRKPGQYDDALEAAEEPIWDSYHHYPPNVDDQIVWEDMLGVRQVKDLVRRTTGKQWKPEDWDNFAGPRTVRALGGTRLMDRQRKKIVETVNENLRMIRTETVHPEWATGEIVACYTPKKSLDNYKIIDSSRQGRVQKSDYTPKANH